MLETSGRAAGRFSAANVTAHSVTRAGCCRPGRRAGEFATCERARANRRSRSAAGVSAGERYRRRAAGQLCAGHRAARRGAGRRCAARG
jgi:hypothetical protein